MFTQLPNYMMVKFTLGALSAVGLLMMVGPECQALPAPLFDASRQLNPDQAKSDLIQVAGAKQRAYRLAHKRDSRHFRFRYVGSFPHYRYTVFEEDYASADYLPPQPHYFSHRYNWYPPLATFRNADPLWYSW
jgi:hypothetical protein